MSNPKGLKNIPAIRQKVAMFLRNICLQVITIHLFGFKVYEFEKNQILFHKYFVRMNILYIFVEIIKKSTTMKNLILTITLIFLTNLLFSQKVIVSLTFGSRFEIPDNMTLTEAINENQLKFYAGIGNSNILEFDLDSKKFNLYVNDVLKLSGDITEFNVGNTYNYTFDAVVKYGEGNEDIMVLYNDKETQEPNLIIMSSMHYNNKFLGIHCVNNDFTVVTK
jgi:hypothetical protein